MGNNVLCPGCKRSLVLPPMAPGTELACPVCRARFTTEASAPLPVVPRAQSVSLAPAPGKAPTLSLPEPPDKRLAPERAIPWYLYAPAVLAVGAPALAISEGLWGGAVGSALGGLLVAGCFVLARRRSWPILPRLLLPMGLVALAYLTVLALLLMRWVVAVPPPSPELHPWLTFGPIEEEFFVSVRGDRTDQSEAGAHKYVFRTSDDGLVFTVLSHPNPSALHRSGTRAYRELQRQLDGWCQTRPEDCLEQPRARQDRDRLVLVQRAFLTEERIYFLTVRGANIDASTPAVREFLSSFRRRDAQPFLPAPKVFRPTLDEKVRAPDQKIAGVIDFLPPQLSPDGRWVAATLAEGGLGLWDVAGGRWKRKGAEDRRLAALAFSPNSKLLAASILPVGVVDLWATDTGEWVRTLPRPVRDVKLLAFAPDSKALALSERNTTHLWDVEPPRERLQFEPKVPTWRLLFAPDGKSVAMLATDGTLVLGDCVAGGVRQVDFPPNPPHAKQPLGGPLALDWKAQFTLQSRPLLLKGGEPLTLHDGLSGRVLVSFPWDADRADTLALSPDGKTVAVASRRGVVHLFETATGTERALLYLPMPDAPNLTFSRNGKVLAAATLDGAILLWDVARGRQRAAFHGGRPRISQTPTLQFSADENWLLASYSDEIKLWDLRRLAGPP